MLAVVQTAWLFTRGPQSVRIVRAAGTRGSVHLHIHGPGTARESHVFPDVIDCMQFQSEYERRLVESGFALERFTNERRSKERRERDGRAKLALVETRSRDLGTER